MEIFGINSLEFLFLLVIAMLVIGPDKLPEYVAKARDGVKRARDMADGAKGQLKEQMGPEFEDINWRQYDPRQYDPRKIVRQALFDEPQDGEAQNGEAQNEAAAPVEADAPQFQDTSASYLTRYDPDRTTPWDSDAT